MITKEDIVAIINGDTPWYVVVAKAHGVACQRAYELGDKGMMKKAHREWWDFADRVSESIHYDVCVAFASEIKAN
jgi:predicted phosphohydrolase